MFAAEFGWRPEPHSIDEVELWSKRLREVFEIDAKGNIFQTRALSKVERRFIANERAMCAASCYYFLTRYYWIKAKSRILRFAFRQGQWILWKMLQELDAAGVSKLLQILKARQLGISTLAEGIMTWGALFIPGVSSQIGSADGQKTQIMLGMMTLAIDQLPPWLPPTQTRSKTASDRALLEFSRVGSLIMVQPGSIRGGMGQGATPTMVHLSEVSQYTNPVQQLDEGLFKALHEGPELVVLLESTGDAAHRSAWWWKEQWIANRDNYWSGNAKFLPVFLPWHTTPELYPGEQWLKKFPMPADFSPNDDTIAHIRRAEAYVHSAEMLRRVLGQDWTLPKEQQWYWQFNHEDHKRRRVEKSWYRQMPCVTGDTRVSTERGMIPIGQAALVGMCESGKVLAVWPTGDKPIFELHTKQGRILRATANHLVKSGEYWVPIEELAVGVPVNLLRPMFAVEEYEHRWNETPLYECRRTIDEKMGRLLGYFMGDGCFHQQELDISCDAKDEDAIAEVSTLIEEVTGKKPWHQNVGKMVRLRSPNQFWVPFLRSLGAIHPVIHSTLKRPDGWRRKVCVPECIFRSPRHVVRAFLSALFECDAHANKKVPRIALTSSHDDFLRDAQKLLLGFNINARLLKKKKVCGGSVKGGKRHEYTMRELVLVSAFANRFYEDIGFRGKRKQESGKRRESDRYANDALVDEVLAVVETGATETVYDMTVAVSRRFSANGIEVHNCDDYEALLGEHDKVVGQEAVELMESTVAKVEDTPVYQIAGDGIMAKYEPKDGDVWNGDDAPPRFRCHWTTPRREKLEWMFIPLVPVKASSFDPLERLLIWEEPQVGFDYSMGIDTGMGVGGDRSIITVTRYGPDADPDVQVAEWASDSVALDDVYAYIASIAAFYSRHMTQKPHPKIAIEMKRKFGDGPYHVSKLMGFHRWHEWGQGFDRKTFDARVGKHGRIGWYTNEWSRPLLLSRFQSAVENGWYIVRSKWLAEELAGLEQKTMPSGKTRTDHESGGHNDRVFAAAMSYFTLHQWDVMAERMKKRYDAPNESEFVIEHGPAVFTTTIGGDRKWAQAS